MMAVGYQIVETLHFFAARIIQWTYDYQIRSESAIEF